MNYKRVLVIGDIHGNYDKLKSLYNKVNPTPDDLVIFLGDYIDRGPKIVEVLKFMVEEVKKPNVIALRGNHEQMMLDYFDSGDYTWIIPGNGGNQTQAALRKWVMEDEDALNKVLDFVENLKLFYRMTINGKDYFFCHAGVNPNIPLDEQDEQALLWYREEFFIPYDGDTIIVGGHTPLQMLKPESEYKPEPTAKRDRNVWRSNREALAITDCKPQWRKNDKILMMDTGSFLPKGFISCIDLVSGKLWQSDPS